MLESLGSSTYAALNDKVTALSKEARARFLSDFAQVDDALLNILQDPSKKAFKAWEKLAEISGDTKKWLSKSESIIKKVYDKGFSEADIDKLKKYYTDHQMPSDRPSSPPFTYKGTDFDDFGHPNFVKDVPDIDGKKIGYQPESLSGKPALTGKGGDMTEANKWIKETFNEPGKAPIVKDGTKTGRIQIYDPNSPFKDTDGWVDCVWHHHEDAKTMIPVPYQVHNRAEVDGIAHTGGAAILKDPNLNNSKMVGFFNSPSGITITF